MKRKILLSFFLLLSCIVTMGAATFPTVSTAGNTTWYFIQFSNSKNVIAAQGLNQKALCASMTGQKSQLWKIEGNETEGYTFTNQLGEHLYVTTTAKEGMLHAGNQTTNKNFLILPVGSGNNSSFVIVPKDNNAVALNQWRGPGVGHEIGLWDKGDGNNHLIFTDQHALDEYKALPRLIPYPKSLTRTEGAVLPLQQLTTMTYVSEETKRYAADFAAQLATTSGISLHLVAATSNPLSQAINMQVDTTLGNEAYRLRIDAQQVVMTAKTKAGFFYALQTLKQLLPNAFFGKAKQASAAWTLPQLRIADEPQLGHRGFMVDVARHFFSKQEIMRVLDILAFYKMNRFHWHLTDDQGWRVEIPEYPLLTKVGARRKGSFSNAGTNPSFFDDTEYGRGMYYTLDDLREVVAYAAERNIEILPEIDLPGHMVAAVSSYPIFSCDPTKEYAVRIPGGISQDVLNIGKDTTIHFLKCILGHIAEVFPHPYIHLGGDECPTTQWENNPDCLKRVQEKNLKGVNELQSWLVEELGVWLKEKYNKDIVVWDELLHHWKSTNKVKPLIMAWNGAHLTATAADKGFQSIFVPYQSLYFDMMQAGPHETFTEEGYQGGWGENWVVDVPKVYHANPVGSLGNRPQFCIGVQGNMWTETCNDSTQLEYQLLPRLLALSEVGWLPQQRKNWTSFFVRMQGHDEILDSLHYHYAKHFFLPDEQSEEATLAQEGKALLAATRAGEAGYPSEAACEALRRAVEQTETGTMNAAGMAAALREFKEAEITPLTDGATYLILSASTFYKKRYAGSTVYESKGGLRFHYTPQQEPEELWIARQTATGWQFENVMSGKKMMGSTYNHTVKTSDKAAVSYRIDKATVAVKGHDYVPGAVTISHPDKYSETATGSVKRFFGSPKGEVIYFDDPQLCHPATWRFVRVEDYTAQLRGLVRKGEHIVEDYVENVVGQPTVATLNFLKDELLTPAKADLQQAVDKATYEKYLEVYRRYLAMERVSPADVLDEDHYYRIRNVYFNTYFAAANASSHIVTPSAAAKSDIQLWQVKKNADGTVYLINKAQQMAGMVTSSSDGMVVKVGNEYGWKLQQHTTSEGQTGINILDKTGKYSWYTNPSAFPNVVLKPYTYGASIWKFEKQDETVSGISAIHAQGGGTHSYDLQGRTTHDATRGIVVTSDGKKVLR